MLKKTKLAKSLLIAFSGTTALYGGAALAQQAPQELQRVTVTGSNIPRSDTETPSPVQVITADEIKKSGYTTVSEVLRDLTANGQGTLSQGFSGAFAAGASGVSLRGLTVGATLVLIDGHRMAPYPLTDDGERSFVDISSIPFAIVDHIEILKDGASAVYGSDAIAGVVNVILKKNFDGTLVSADAGTTQHGGGTTKNAAVTHGFGKASDTVNGYVTLEYRHQDPVRLNQRNGAFTNFDWTSIGGLDLRPGARNAVVTSPRLLSPYLQVPGSSTGSAANFAFYPGCTYAQMRASQCEYENNWAQLQPESENINLLGRLNVRLSPDWDANVTASYFDSKNKQTRAPSTLPFGTFAGNTAIGPGLTPQVLYGNLPWTYPATSPGNTLGVAANIRALLPDRGPRVDDVDSKSMRLVAEINGSVAGWDVKGSAGYTRVDTTQTFSGYINYPNLSAALQNTTTPFLLNGGNSAAVMDFVSPTVSAKATDTLSFLEGRVGRDLFALDGGPFQVAAGGSYVHKDLNQPDPQQAQNGTMALNGAYALGKENNTSAYLEAVAPVLKMLELDAAVRFDHFDTYGNSTTPRGGFKFVPFKELTVRGTVSRGFRAPSATENGNAGSLFGFNAIRDPQLCPTSNADGSPNLTAATNVPAYCSFNPTYLQVSNKNLQPEKSTSYTLGLILEPVQSWVTTLDYYQISLDNQIIPEASLATYDPLASAVRAGPQTVTFGDGSTGTSSVGPIQYSTSKFVNGQKTVTSGLEFETKYRFKLVDASQLTVGFQLTHMLKYDLTLNGTTYHLAGTHGPAITSGDTGNPKDRAQFRLSWDKGPFTITSTTNYISGYDVTDPSSNVNTCDDALNATNGSGAGYNSQFLTLASAPSQYCRVQSFTYTNVTGQYRVNNALTLRAGITNLFDRQPPLDLATYGGTGSNASSNGSGAPYNPSLHQIGALGRAFTLGMDYKF
jgi:iron complex outermembrane receptor protein